MASRGSQGIPPTNRESFLSRKQKEIVDKSMDLFQQSLDRCLENSVSAPRQEAVARRRAKRARDDDYAEECASVGHAHGGDVKGTAEPRQARTKKTRLSPQEPSSGGKKFACPFCKHDPAKYGNVKTCCGPGWEDVHRVKEHVYRRHSLKNFCPRCFEHFDKPESLMSHQRADKPCAVHDRSPDTITDEQEKQLRARAKSNSDEKAKWENMYRIIFPGEKVPTPYYDASTSPTSDEKNKSGASPGAGSATSRWESLDDCKEFLRTEIPRLVRPAIEQYVATLFEEVQDKVNQKTAEIIRDVETRLLWTFHFQEEQASSALLAAPVPGAGAGASGLAVAAGAGEPSPPPSPGVGAGGPELSSKLTDMFELLRQDSIGNELCGSLQFDLEGILAAQQGIPACDGFSVDSAYYTSSSSGGQAVYGLGGAGYPLRY